MVRRPGRTIILQLKVLPTLDDARKGFGGERFCASCATWRSYNVGAAGPSIQVADAALNGARNVMLKEAAD